MVKCKKWFIFCIWFCFFYIFYFNFILANRLASPFIRSPPFYLAPYFIRSPPFIQSIKTKLFLFIIHSLLLLLLLLLPLLLLQVVLVSRRPSIVRTCKNVLELRNYAKHTINAIILLLNTHLFLCSPPIIYPAIPRKKNNNYFLSTSHLVYPFQKSVVLC